MIDQIVDLIIREALSRGGDLPAKIGAVKTEVMLKTMEIAANYREGERKEKLNESSKHQTRTN